LVKIKSYKYAYSLVIDVDSGNVPLLVCCYLYT